MAEAGEQGKVCLLMTAVVLFLGVTVQSQFVLTWNITSDDGGQSLPMNFSQDIWTQFYGCLCSNGSKTCRVFTTGEDYVSISGIDETEQLTNFGRYGCRRTSTYLICTICSATSTDCSNMKRCLSFSLTNSDSSSCNIDPVVLLFTAGSKVTSNWHNDSVSETEQCEVAFFTIESSADSTTKTPDKTTYASTAPVDSTAKQSQDDDGDETTIIIAVVVSILAVLIVAAIFGIVLWRRKKKATTRATSYATKDNTGSNGNTANPAPANGGGASNATDLHNYSLATIDRDGKGSGNTSSVPVSYAKVDLEKKQAARRSAAESTNNEVPQYSEYNSHQNYSEVGPPVPPYNGGNIATGAHGFSDNSTPKFIGNGKTVVNGADNGVSYSEIAVNNNDDEDNETEPYSVSGASGPSGSKTGTNVDDPQYSFASDVKPGPGNVYSQLHDPVRNITNPYNDLMPEDGSANNNVETRPGHEYSRLHDPVRSINNPYNVLMADGDQLNNRTSV